MNEVQREYTIKKIEKYKDRYYNLTKKINIQTFLVATWIILTIQRMKKSDEPLILLNGLMTYFDISLSVYHAKILITYICEKAGLKNAINRLYHELKIDEFKDYEYIEEEFEDSDYFDEELNR